MSDARSRSPGALHGRVALVTGSTSGIGLGIARALAAEGCAIVLHGLVDRPTAERLVSEFIEQFDVEAIHHGADLRDVGQIETLCHETIDRFGHVDILVNNAGVQFVRSIESFAVSEWNRILAVNLSAAFHTIRCCLPTMRSNKWGRIINTASTHGLVASVDKSAYVAAKHGLVGLTKVVALETAGTGITCNAICPGWTRTELVEKQIEARAEKADISIEEAAASLLSEKQPSGQFVTPEQIGAFARFLCSDAADQITGAALPIDGAWTAQ